MTYRRARFQNAHRIVCPRGIRVYQTHTLIEPMALITPGRDERSPLVLLRDDHRYAHLLRDGGARPIRASGDVSRFARDLRPPPFGPLWTG